MARRKREAKRVPKESRKNLKMWAEGARETILAPYMEEYSKALDEGWRAERKCLKRICNEFHARVDWRVRDHEEPVLADYDPKKMIVPEVLPDEVEIQKRTRIEVINARIQRWYKYRIRKTRKHRVSAARDPTKDPYAVLVSKLAGIKPATKARQAYQQLMHESYEDKIAEQVAADWEEEGNLGRAKPKAGFRAKVAREVFAKLPVEEQRALAARAKKEAAEKREAFEKALNNPPSTLPADRQKCIDRVSDFLGPILRGLQEYTGLHSVVIMGGPIPKFGGELRTLHVSYGRDRTATGQHFPQWDKKRFNTDVLDFMKEYLAASFTPQECAEAALPGLDDLAKAKYTINDGDNDASSKVTGKAKAKETSDSDSDNDSTSDSDSDSDSDSESGIDSEGERPSKKSKLDSQSGSGAAAGPSSAARPPFTPVLTENARTYEQERAVNVARNKAMAEKFKAQMVADGLMPPPKPKATRKPRAVKGSIAAVRKSTRLSGAIGTGTENMDVDGGVGGGDGEGVAGDRDGVDTIVPRPRPRPIARKLQAPATPSTTMRDAPLAPPSTAPTTSPDTAMLDAPPAPPSTAPATSPDTAMLDVPPAPPSTAPATSPDLAMLDVPPAPPSTGPATSDTAMRDAPPAPPSTAPATYPDATSTSTSTAPLNPAHQTPPAPPPDLAVFSRPPCPAKAAPWFVDAYTAMTRQNLGPHFDAVVAAWIRLEAASKYEQGPTNLPSKHRPKQVGSWIASARGTRGSPDPKIPDPEAYAVEWQAWWDALQPAWREKGGDGKWSVTGEYGGGGKEWGALYQWGVNGTLSLVASLYFWGCAVGQNADRRMAWEGALLDVSWMLEGMAIYYEKFNRRF